MGTDAPTADPPGAGATTIRRGPWFPVGLVVGGLLMAVGVRGLLADPDGTHPPLLARWVLGLAVTHDALLAPAVAIAGLVLGRIVPARVRGPIRTGAAMSAMVALFAWPLVGGYGRHERNDSTLPLDYSRNLVIVLAVIWVGVAVGAVVRARSGARP